MDFAFSEEQDELRASARGFLSEHSGSAQVRQAMESDAGYSPSVWKQISAELGWTGVTIPEAYGGLGLGAVELTALLEVMGESLLCAPFFSTLCMGANALMVAGTEEQRREHLPRIAEGLSLATLAQTGPSGRWSPDGVETTWSAEGDDYRLRGRASFVLDGHSADLLIVAARAQGSSGEDGISLFCLPSTTAGVGARLLPSMDQTRKLAEIDFDAVRVPATARMRGEDRAWPLLQEILDRAAIGLAAEQVGGAQRCLDMAVAYAKERVQFGRPIGSFQAVKHKCADMMIQLESARSAAYYAACVAADGGDDLSVVASLAKAYCSDASFQCAADCIQIHGGVGFTWEYDVHLYFKRARASGVFLGDAAYHRERVARGIGL
jgi:alkylation response protein AidB-like acyl-CoA dehydrogenase